MNALTAEIRRVLISWSHPLNPKSSSAIAFKHWLHKAIHWIPSRQTVDDSLSAWSSQFVCMACVLICSSRWKSQRASRFSQFQQSLLSGKIGPTPSQMYAGNAKPLALAQRKIVSEPRRATHTTPTSPGLMTSQEFTRCLLSPVASSPLKHFYGLAC